LKALPGYLKESVIVVALALIGIYMAPEVVKAQISANQMWLASKTLETAAEFATASGAAAFAAAKLGLGSGVMANANAGLGTAIATGFAMGELLRQTALRGASGLSGLTEVIWSRIRGNMTAKEIREKEAELKQVSKEISDLLENKFELPRIKSDHNYNAIVTQRDMDDIYAFVNRVKKEARELANESKKVTEAWQGKPAPPQTEKPQTQRSDGKLTLEEMKQYLDEVEAELRRDAKGDDDSSDESSSD